MGTSERAEAETETETETERANERDRIETKNGTADSRQPLLLQTRCNSKSCDDDGWGVDNRLKEKEMG